MAKAGSITIEVHAEVEAYSMPTLRAIMGLLEAETESERAIEAEAMEHLTALYEFGRRIRKELGLIRDESVLTVAFKVEARSVNETRHGVGLPVIKEFSTNFEEARLPGSIIRRRVPGREGL